MTWGIALVDTAQARLGLRDSVKGGHLPGPVSTPASAFPWRGAVERQAELMASRLRGMTAQLVQAEEQERQRISALLHEDVQQLIAAARYTLRGLYDQSPKQACVQGLEEVERILAQVATITRTLCHDLFTPQLESGLGSALEWLAGDMRDRHGLTLKLRIEAHAEPIAADMRQFAFSAVRELLFNVVKHAEVREAEVWLEPARGHAFCMGVRDFGRGFDDHGKGPVGHGLAKIRERTRCLGGSLAFQSAPGNGASIAITLPRSSAGGLKSELGCSHENIPPV